MDEHELSFCEKDRTKENTNLPKICSKTLKKYMFMLVDAVEKKITTLALAASPYALIFDGWTEDSTHFVSLSSLFLLKIRHHSLLTSICWHLRHCWTKLHSLQPIIGILF